MEFTHSWWWGLLVVPAAGIVGRVVWGWYKAYVKTTPNPYDDLVVQEIEEAKATYDAGKAAKEARDEPAPSVQQQSVVSPELTEEQKQQLSDGP